MRLRIAILFFSIFMVACGGGGGGGAPAPAPAPLPSLQFTPAAGAVGTIVTITGTDFSSTKSVTVGGVAAVVVSSSASTLTALVMPGAASGPVKVTTANGTLAATGVFTVTATGVPAVQQGAPLVGTGATGVASQGIAVAVSADGDTALVGGSNDNSGVGAAWIYTRSGSAWTQQGQKLVGTGALGAAGQGISVALSADGNTALVGGYNDNAGIGAAWVYSRSGGTWTQQGAKLIGSGAVGAAKQGYGVAISGDGNTAIVCGNLDDAANGATWVFTRSGGAWTQQGTKLVGSGAIGPASQGSWTALSADGSTAIVGGGNDNSNAGAAWVFTRSAGAWTQQGPKLSANDAVGAAFQGISVALSADGNTALVGGYNDNTGAGAAWVYTRSSDVWTQQGAKLVGTGAVGAASQGISVSLSADGNTALVGGYNDNAGIGAAWVSTRSSGTWTQPGPKLVGAGSQTEQGFGVALSADGNTAVVGGPSGDSGAAWVFVP